MPATDQHPPLQFSTLNKLCVDILYQVWGMLEYMDDVLGRLFDFMEHSKLRDNTYILVMSDNGAELFPEERRGEHRQVSHST